MKSRHSVLVFPFLVLVATFNIAQTNQTSETAAQKAAETWMRLIDSREFAQAWNEASPYLKSRITKLEWERNFRAFGDKSKELADKEPRKPVEAKLVKSLPSFKNQEGVVLKYTSSFEGHKTMDETLEMVLERDEKWRVANYDAIVLEPLIAPLGAQGVPSKQDSVPRPPVPSPVPDFETRVPTSVDVRPVLLNHPKPNYTEVARKNRIEGVVAARVLVESDGTVSQIRIIRGLPDGLNEEATKAMNLLRYKPAMKNGQPVPFWAHFELEFKLTEK